MDLAVNKIIYGDCLEVMKQWPDKCVDLILTDPPYTLTCNKKGKGTGFYKNKEHLSRISESFGSKFSPADFLKYINISRNGIIAFGSQKQLLEYLILAEKHKFKWEIMYWHKPNAVPAHFNHLLCDTEFIYRIYKPGSYFNNYLDYQKYHKYYLVNVAKGFWGDCIDHPTPKPLEILLAQVELFSQPDDLILDPFCGSGTTCVAAKMLGRNYIGIDISEEYCEIARMRLKAIETGVPVKEQKQGQMGLFS